MDQMLFIQCFEFIILSAVSAFLIANGTMIRHCAGQVATGGVRICKISLRFQTAIIAYRKTAVDGSQPVMLHIGT